MSKDNDEQKLLAAALQRLRQLELSKCIDPYNLRSRPYPKQQEIMDDISTVPIRSVTAANQTGKTALGAWEGAHLLSRTHPTYKMPDHPLTLLVFGRVGEQIESNIWRAKIKPFLKPGTFKEVRIGNILQRVEHENGNVMIFMSHHDINQAREKAQGFVADWVWIDEMVRSVSFLVEVAARVQANPWARMILTFTPLLRSQEVKRWIEGLKAPIGKKYCLHMLDNPIYAGREQEIIDRYANVPEAERRARLYGEWYAGDLAVYDFEPEHHAISPQEYHPAWRHLLAVDPAGSGKAGVVLLAERPETGQWFVIKDTYLKGAAATDLLPKIAAFAGNVNIVRRVCDPHESWFMQEARKQGITFVGVYKKNQRKKELIKQLQESLYDGKLKIAPWCLKLIEELTTCQWSETVRDKIIGSSRFHLLDSVQYAVDNLPKWTPNELPKSYDQALKQANKERKVKEATRGVRRGRVTPKIRSKWGHQPWH